MENNINSIKAILSIHDFTQELGIPNARLRVSFGNDTKIIPLPLKDALLIETKEVQAEPMIQLQIEGEDGDMIGYAELKLPKKALSTGEYEGTQSITFQLLKGSEPALITSVHSIYLTKRGSNSAGSTKIESPGVARNRATSHTTIPTSPVKLMAPKRTLDEENLFQLTKVEENMLNDAFNDPNDPRLSSANYPTSPKNSSNIKSPGKYSNNSPNTKEFKKSTSLRASFIVKDAKEIKEVKEKKESEKHNPKTKSYQHMIDKYNNQVSTEKSLDNFSQAALVEEKKPLKLALSPLRSPSLTDSDEEASDEDVDPSQFVRRYEREPSIANFHNSNIVEEEISPEEKTMAEVFFTLEKNCSGQKYTKAHVDFLKNVFANLEFKVTEFNLAVNENQRLKEDIERIDEQHQVIESRSASALEALKDENAKLREHITSILGQTGIMNSQISQLNEELMKSKANNSKLMINLSQKDNELVEMNIKTTELTDLKSKVANSQEALSRAEEQRGDDQRRFLKTLAELRMSLEDSKLNNEKLSQEKRDLLLQLSQEKIAHQEAKNDMAIMERNLRNAEAYKELVKSVEIQRDELVRQIGESRVDRDEVFNLLTQAQASLSSVMKEKEAKEGQYLKKIGTLEEDAKTNEGKIATLAADLQKVKLQASNASSLNKELERKIYVQGEMENQVSFLQKKVSESDEYREALNNKVRLITENQEKMSRRAMELGRTNDLLSNIILQKDQEIDELKKEIEDLGNLQPIPEEPEPQYIPAKDDAVDCALANYLNRNKECSKYKVLFIRESEGVYQFGTRKIYIKVEGEKVLIRVGGGFMTLEELIEQIAPVEYDKLVRYSKLNDDAARIMAKNIAINKIIAGKCINPIEKSKTQAYRLMQSNLRELNSAAYAKIESKEMTTSPKRANNRPHY